MPHDYANPESTSPFKHAMKWLAIGFVSALLCVGGFVCYRYAQHHPKESVSQMIVEAAQHQPAATVHRKAHKKTRFEFYHTLTHKKQANHPAAWKPAIKNQVTKQRTAPDPAVQAHYSLQVASVQHFHEADRLKAQLTLQGYKVKITKATIHRQSWHRVVVGPYQRRQDAVRVQQRLAKNHQRIMLIKQKT